jgi:hypothetical protein
VRDSYLRITVLALATSLSAVDACSPNRMPFGRALPPSSSTVCALGIPGVRTSVRDTPDGVELTLVAVGNATELRNRAHAALAGKYPLRPESKALAARVRATIRDEPCGLVVHLVPIDEAQLSSVRDATRRLIDDLTWTTCD